LGLCNNHISQVSLAQPFPQVAASASAGGRKMGNNFFIFGSMIPEQFNPVVNLWFVSQ